jgi:hypothetical protein
VQAALAEFYAERSKRSTSVWAQRQATRLTDPVPARPATDKPLGALDDPATFEGEKMGAALNGHFPGRMRLVGVAGREDGSYSG